MERRHAGEIGAGAGHPRRSRAAERLEPGPRRHQQPVRVAVMAAGELHDQVASGCPAREASWHSAVAFGLVTGTAAAGIEAVCPFGSDDLFVRLVTAGILWALVEVSGAALGV